MSATLRRRGGASTLSATIQEADSESDLTILEGDEKQPAVEIHAEVVQEKPKTRKRRNTFIFLLGSLFGIVAAGFFASTNDLIDFPELGDLSVDSLLDVLPAGLVRDYRDLLVSTRSIWNISIHPGWMDLPRPPPY